MPFPYLDKKNYVFSRSPNPPAEHVEFISHNAVEFMKQLKKQVGQNIWLIGGGQLNTLVLNAGLLDEIILTYIPIVLGKGIPLFADGAREHMLKLQNTRTYDNGFTQLTLQLKLTVSPAKATRTSYICM